MPPPGRSPSPPADLLDPGAHPGSFNGRMLLVGATLVGLVLLVSLVIGWLTPGYEGDMNQNKAWARWLVRSGMREAYRANIDYPPVPLYAFAAAGWVYQWIFDPIFDERAALASHVFSFLLKLPVILCHVLLTGLLFWLAAPRGSRAASLVAGAYGLNPAMLYDVAHFGQTDSLLGLAAVGAAAALFQGRALLVGVLAAVLMLTKPQGWPLLPAIGAIFWREPGLGKLLRAKLGGVLATLGILGPWIIGDRIHHLGRFLANLEAHDISNRVISADAHNLWWIPTLLHGDWIEDSTPLLGPVSYRTLALALALGWLALCAWAAWRRSADPFLIAAATSFGFFMLMVRAHENHAYLALALLAGSIAVRPRAPVWRVYWLGSVGLLLNLVLRDPLVMGPFTSVPDPGQDAPVAVVALQLLNVAINAIVLGALARLLIFGARPPGEAGRA